LEKPPPNYSFFIRQLHPLIIHFTIVFILSTLIFIILFFVTGLSSFETTAFHCLGAALISLPVALVTGLTSQRRYYPEKLQEMFQVEISLSRILLLISLVAFVWRLLNPDILLSWGWRSIIYFLLILSLTPLVTVISFFGGLLIFPLENDR
jgi:uncharacterized membrane protein